MSSVLDWGGSLFGGKSWADNKVDPNLKNFQKAADDYKNNIDKNTGANAANSSMNWGMSNGQKMYSQAKNAGVSDGQKMYQNARDESKKETAGMADQLTQKQSSGAASQALGNAVSAGMTRGRAANDSGKIAADAYSNNYANNYNTQLNQQNALMNTNLGMQGNMMNANLGQQNNMMNAYSQQLANNQNAYGTLMSSNLAADQAKYNQNWNNQKQASKASTGILGNVMDAISDGSLKDKAKVGLDGEEDIRMAHYKRCGDKLKRMNPNKWKELKWEGN